MAFTSNAITVGISATLIFEEDEAYDRLIVKNTHATNSAFLGGSGVTTANGFELVAGATLTLHQTSDASDDLYAIATVTSTVRYLAY